MKIESKTSETGTNGYENKTAPTVITAPLNGAKSGMARDFYTVLADIEYLVKDVAQLSGEDLARTSQKISEHIATARKTVETMGDTLAERANQTVTATNDYVQDQPWKAIGIGATVGLVLGVLLTRRA